jgi:hypothetical protein
MFEEAKKQAIIVYRKQEEAYAHLLANLITATYNCEVAEWNEREWNANKASTSSSQKVIFLGDTEEAHKRHLGMYWVFNLHNMKFGWLGNQCIVDVDPLPAERVQAFCDYYKSQTSLYCHNDEVLKLPVLVKLLEEPSFASHDEGKIEKNEVTTIGAEVASQPELTPESKVANPFVALVSKAVRNTGDVIDKLSTQAVKLVDDPIKRKKLVKHQYALLIVEFVFNDGLRRFMEG